MGGAAMLPAQAHAQATAEETTGADENSSLDIIVTAQKRAQSINDVGLTITALGSDALDKQGIKSLDDLAKMVPGLTYAGTDFGTPVFTLRGVGYYDNSLQGYPTTSVYVDEVPLPFPVMAAHANLDLERVEVLKGPQGTLFGQNSTGGAINYIAAKPTKELAAGLSATVGRFGQGEATGYISGPITDTLGVRLAGQYQFGSPWQRSYTRDDTLGKKDALNGRLIVEWKPTSDFKVSLNINGWRDRSDPMASQFVAIFPQTVLPDGSSPIDPALSVYPFAPRDPRAADWSPNHRPEADKKQYQGSLRMDYDVSDNIVLTSISNYVKYETYQRLDMDGTSRQIFEYTDEGSIKSFTQELRLAGGEGTPFHWVFGGNYEKSSVYEATSQRYADGSIGRIFGGLSGANSADSKKRNYAFFANGEYEAMEGLTFKAGGRYTNSRQTLDACTFDTGDGSTNATVLFLFQGLQPPGTPLPNLQIGDCITFDANFFPGRFNNVLKEDNFSWRLGVDYKASRNLLLYANVAKGYKAGGYPVIGAILQDSYLPVVQESLMDYEAGFKAQMLGRKLGLNGAVFWYDYRNKQLLTKKPDLIIGLISVLDNIPKSRVRGAELELTAAPVEGLHISGGLTYLDAKITNYIGINAGGAQDDFAGTSMPFTSKWQYNLNADYTVPTSGNVRPFVGATLTGRTSTTSIVGSAMGAVTNPGYRSAIPLATTYDVPAYALLDLRAGVEAADESWRLMVWGKNVTNKYYWQNAVLAYENAVRYAGMPATYGVTFSYKFGG
jgi:outer membrane receptor protein involved in Fe transport